MSDASHSISKSAKRLVEIRRISTVQIVTGVCLAAAGCFIASLGLGARIEPAHPIYAVLLLIGGLILISQTLMSIFKMVISRYSRICLSDGEAESVLYMLRISSALLLVGLRLLIQWHPLQTAIDILLAGILLFFAQTQMRDSLQSKSLGGALKIVASAICVLSACAAVAILYCSFAGFGWTAPLSATAFGFAIDNLWCGLIGGRLSLGNEY